MIAHLGAWMAEARVQLFDIVARSHAPHEVDVEGRNAATLAATKAEPCGACLGSDQRGQGLDARGMVRSPRTGLRRESVGTQGRRRTLRTAPRPPSRLGSGGHRPADPPKGNEWDPPRLAAANGGPFNAFDITPIGCVSGPKWNGCSGAPDRTRTCDLWVRNPTLYPLSYRRASANHTRSRLVRGSATGPEMPTRSSSRGGGRSRRSGVSPRRSRRAPGTPRAGWRRPAA